LGEQTVTLYWGLTVYINMLVYGTCGTLPVHLCRDGKCSSNRLANTSVNVFAGSLLE